MPIANVDESHTLSITRTIDATRAAVWRCWTEPELLKQWFCPKPWSVPEADFDLRPGGRMNCLMAGPAGERVETIGCWLEIDPPVSLTFTDAFSEGFVPRPNPFMTGFVHLSDHPDGGTQMVWGARHASAEDRKRHLEMGFEAGWAAAAQQLEDVARTL